MGISVFPAAGGGASVSDGNTAGWNLGSDQVELISEYKTTTLVNTITISSIPQTYRKLIIDWNGMETAGVGSHNVRLRPNGSTSSGCSEHGYRFDNSTPAIVPINYSASSDGFFVAQVPNVTGGQMINGRILIENYTSTDTKIGHGSATYYANFDVTKVWTRLSFRTGTTTPAITSITFIAGAGNTLGFGGSASDGLRVYGVK